MIVSACADFVRAAAGVGRGFISVRGVVSREQRRVEDGVPEQDELDRDGVRGTAIRVAAAGDLGVVGQLAEGLVSDWS